MATVRRVQAGSSFEWSKVMFEKGKQTVRKSKANNWVEVGIHTAAEVCK